MVIPSFETHFISQQETFTAGLFLISLIDLAICDLPHNAF